MEYTGSPDGLEQDSQTNLLGVDVNSAELAIEFLKWCKQVRNRSESTCRTYGSVLSAWLDFIGPMDVRAATLETFESFMTRPRPHKQSSRGTERGTPATQRKDSAVLRSFYSYLWQRGYTTYDRTRALHGPTVRNENPKPIADTDWVQLWTWALGVGPGVSVPLGLGYTCGLRRSEIVSLRGLQVTNNSIIDFVRKGGGQDTLPWREMVGVVADNLPFLLPHPETFATHLMSAARKDGGSGIMVTWLGQPDMFNKRMVKWCASAGVPQYTPHQLRHSCATNLLRSGVPLHLASRLMNHSNVATTMRYVKAGAHELTEWRNTNRS
jgi:integrase/recombinase XerC